MSFPSSTNPHGAIGQERAQKKAALEAMDQKYKPHVLELGSLQILRAQTKIHPQYRPIYNWLSIVCPEAHQKPVERDPFIPSIVYAVEFRMRDQEITQYYTFHKIFKLAEWAYEFAAGSLRIDGKWLIENRMKELGIEEGKTALEVLRESAERDRLGLQVDLSRPAEREWKQNLWS